MGKTSVLMAATLSSLSFFGLSAQDPESSDPVSKALEAPLKQYRSEIEKARADVVAVMKAKEKAAREARNPKIVDQIVAEINEFEKQDRIPKGVSSDNYRKETEKSVRKMRVAFETLIGDYLQAGKDDERKAVERSFADFNRDPRQFLLRPRNRWANAQKSFERVDGSEWVLIEGDTEKNYRETGRTADYVEISRTSLNPSRKRIVIRIFNDHTMTQHNSGNFSRSDEGSWSIPKPSSPPEQVTGFGETRFGSGEETVQGVEVKVGDPQITLIWDTKADLDLHVIEPGGSELYWEERKGKQGGSLDVDDTDGQGPENVSWVAGDLNNQLTKGTYKWFVHYYGMPGGSQNVLTRWKVRVKHDGKFKIYDGRLTNIGQRSQIYSLKID